MDTAHFDAVDQGTRLNLSRIRANQNCLWIPEPAERLIIGKCGRQGHFEALAMLRSLHPWEGAWYGHVVEAGPNLVAAMLVWADSPSAGFTCNPLESFRREVIRAGTWHPCAVQADDDAFGVFGSPAEALIGLAEMVRRFDPAKRWPDERGPYANSRLELRIAGPYGLADLAAKAA